MHQDIYLGLEMEIDTGINFKRKSTSAVSEMSEESA